MRYKVNIHVLLYFLSSCSTMTWSQASNILSHGNSASNGNHTQVANTLLINVNHNNNSQDNDDSAARQHPTTYLASENDRIPTALASNNVMGRTQLPKIQTGKFIDTKLMS